MAARNYVVAAAAAAFAGRALAQSPESAVIRSGVEWKDTDGNRMYAGGANLVVEGDAYYLVGEGKKTLGADCSACFNLYSTKDLTNWKLEGCVLRNQDIVAPPPWNKESFYRMERPKIFKCPKTGKWMMWFHCDTSGFDMRSVGVLTADDVTGPYSFVAPCFKPDGQDSYDMGTFVDDASVPGGDGSGYLIRSVQNKFAGISRMTDDCTNVTGICSSGPDMEGQAIMRDSNGTLYAAGSHLTGWAANAAQFVTSPNASLVGAVWTDNYNPSSSSTTYDSQSTFIFPFKHADGHVTHMWMADRWNANGPGGLDNMTLIWLPLVPPTGGSTPSNPQPGWPLALAACNGADPLQAFTFTDTAVKHTASGLCVQGGASNTPLTLETCGGADQTWYTVGSKSSLAVASTRSGSGGGCVNFNNANQLITAGNPIIAYDCGSGASPNALWAGPTASGGLVALNPDGSQSSFCASTGPTSNPNQWTLPWLDAWSLKDY